MRNAWFLWIYGKKKAFQGTGNSMNYILQYTICSPMCVAILILALVGYPYFSTTSYFKVGSCCSIQVSFDSHPAAPEMYRNSTWLPGMRWDSMIFFRFRKVFRLTFGLWNLDVCQPLNFKNPDWRSVVFLWTNDSPFWRHLHLSSNVCTDDNQNIAPVETW